MKIFKMILILAWVLALVFLSACGDSKSTHVASWSDATLVADDTVSRSPQMATDGNGNIIAVWAESTGFYSNRYDAIRGWGTPQPLGDVGYNWIDFRIAVSQSGHAIVAWVQNEFNVQAVRYAPGVGWGGVENVGSIGMLHDVAIDDTGNAFIVAEDNIWRDAHGVSITGLTIARSDHGTGWMYDRIEYTDPSTEGGFPKISVDGAGNGFVIWIEGDITFARMYVSTISQEGLGTPVQIVILGGSNPSWPSISMDDNGNAMALWDQLDSSAVPHTYACRYTPAGGWSAAEQIDSPSGSIDQSLAVDPLGNFYAIWTQRTAIDTSDIYSCRYTENGGWETPLLVGTGSMAQSPRIGADASGNLFAAWLQEDPSVPGAGRFGSEGKVYVNHFRAGSGWGIQQQLQQPLGDASAPALAVDRSGRAMLMWSQSTGSVAGLVSYGTFSSRFE